MGEKIFPVFLARHCRVNDETILYMARPAEPAIQRLGYG
jgi:hypothetical protein